MKLNSSYSIIIPTLNAKPYLSHVKMYMPVDKTLIIDSGSNDGTIEDLRTAGYQVVVINKSDFNHGGTRNLCLQYCESEFVIFFTQDARPFNADTFEELLRPFSDSLVVATYAKQLPRETAGVLEVLDRQFKYPDFSITQSIETQSKLGSRTYFLSNSCAAYRMSVFQSLGGFPESEIMGEDALFATLAISKGYKIIYASNARVIHSHGYTLTQLFKRYFDTGVYRSRVGIMSKGTAIKDVNQGSSYVKYVAVELVNRKEYLQLVNLSASTTVSFAAYLIGKHYFLFPNVLRSKLSMHAFYWSKFKVDESTRRLFHQWKHAMISKVSVPASICVSLLVAYFTRSLWSNQLASLPEYGIYLSLWIFLYFMVGLVLEKGQISKMSNNFNLPVLSLFIAFLMAIFIMFIGRFFPVSRFVVVLSLTLSATLIYWIQNVMSSLVKNVEEYEA